MPKRQKVENFVALQEAEDIHHAAKNLENTIVFDAFSNDIYPVSISRDQLKPFPS